MYFLGDTPVEPAGVPVAAEVPTTVVAAVEAALPDSVPLAPPPTLSAPAPAPAPAPALEVSPPSLPPSISTGAPAPIDYSRRRDGHRRDDSRGDRHDGGHRRHGGRWNAPTPVNVIYSDPTPYYYPSPQSYTEPRPQQPIYIIREQRTNINWLMVIGAVAAIYLLKG